MPTSNQNISFKYGLQAKYDAITTKELDTVYFCTDSQRMFVGDTEYSRPVQHGNTKPAEFMPPNSFFYHETEKILYYSKDGQSWEACANFYAHPTFTAKVVGSNTAGTASFGDTIKIPKITVDGQGHVSGAEDVSIQLPDAPNTDVQVTIEGEGNAVTGASHNGRAITLTKGETFATAQQLTDAINGITEFDVDANTDGTGYENIDALKTAHPTGTKGTFYLVKSGETDADNMFIEYFWTGKAYELAGKFGSIDTSGLATKEDLADKVDKTTTVNGQPLSANVQIDKVAEAGKVTHKLTINGETFDGSTDVTVTTPDTDTTYTFANGVDGSFTVTPESGTAQKVTIGKPAEAGAADHLKTNRKIALSKDVSGEAMFDGSADISISVTVNKSAVSDNAYNDEEGNNIKDTYATKIELADSSLKWGTF